MFFNLKTEAGTCVQSNVVTMAFSAPNIGRDYTKPPSKTAWGMQEAEAKDTAGFFFEDAGASSTPTNDAIAKLPSIDANKVTLSLKCRI